MPRQESKSSENIVRKLAGGEEHPAERFCREFTQDMPPAEIHFIAMILAIGITTFEQIRVSKEAATVPEEVWKSLDESYVILSDIAHCLNRYPSPPKNARLPKPPRSNKEEEAMATTWSQKIIRAADAVKCPEGEAARTAFFGFLGLVMIIKQITTPQELCAKLEAMPEPLGSYALFSFGTMLLTAEHYQEVFQKQTNKKIMTETQAW